MSAKKLLSEGDKLFRFIRYILIAFILLAFIGSFCITFKL